MSTLAFVQTSLGVLDTGAFAVLTPWTPLVVFTSAFLAAADGRRVALRGDEVEVRCVNGAAVYALAPADAAGRRAGTLLRAWGP